MTNQSVLPLFRSHYSVGKSLLTLEEPSTAPNSGPVSVFTLAQEAGLSEVILIDDKIDGLIQAYKSAGKAKTKLIYGIRLVVCADMANKTPESLTTESKVVILVKDFDGYKDLIRIWNRAWGREGHFTFRDWSYGRADWALLKEFWTERLILALPFFDSFIAKNTLTFAQITPNLPVQDPWIFEEEKSGLPFESLISKAIDQYVGEGDHGARLLSKTILYRNREDFRNYIVFRALNEGGVWDNPECKHLCSAEFCMEAYKELAQK